jgi:hypothetical protein
VLFSNLEEAAVDLSIRFDDGNIVGSWAPAGQQVTAMAIIKK